MRWLLLAFLAGCVTPIGPAEHSLAIDLDRDGAENDCDDTNAAVSPNATEWCNGIDDDCDGEIDGPNALGVKPWWVDADGDGEGANAAPLWACERPDSGDYRETDGDCDDLDDSVYSGALEICDGTDNDCDGLIDLADPDVQMTDVYVDSDQDGFGAPGTLTQGCGESGFADNDDDCDDEDGAVNPLSSEVCNDTDDDCNGQVDDGLPVYVLLVDADGDGYGDDDIGPVERCDQSSGYVGAGGDCDDSRYDVNPGVAESVCDGFDDNCDGSIDENLRQTWYRDVDRDGYGDDASTLFACSAPPIYGLTGGDCLDLDPTIFPGAPELCDGKDNDCNSYVDDVVAPAVWYEDLDGDGYGSAIQLVQCDQPSGYVPDGGDCDDGDAARHPGAPELCNGIDDDCDFTIDLGVAPEDLTVWYRDADGDSYGDDGFTSYDCEAPNGFIDQDGDCDDGNEYINPSIPEICADGVDQNCDGLGCSLRGDLTSADADVRIQGTRVDVFLAYSVGAGDLSGDGVADIAMGGIYADIPGDGSRGIASLYFGSLAADWTAGGPADVELYSTEDGELGTALGVADLNGDTDDDLIVSEPGYGGGQGAVHVTYGPIAPGQAPMSGDVLLLSNYNGGFGAALALGDFDHDGAADVLIGGPGYGAGGGVHLVSAPGSGIVDAVNDAATTLVSDGGGQAGESVAAVGDVSGDDIVDVMVGAPGADNATGAVFFLRGPLLPGVLDLGLTADSQLIGTAESGRLGQQVGGADLNGDGYSDLVTSAPWASASLGEAYVLSGPWIPVSGQVDTLATAKIVGLLATDSIGKSLTTGDFNGDGSFDLVLGSDLAEDPSGVTTGTAYVFYGPIVGALDLDDAGAALAGGEDLELFATSMHSADLNTDSYDDLIVGAPEYSGIVGRGGEATIFFGAGP